MNQAVLYNVDARGVATITLNRPECHNALDSSSARLLLDTLEALADAPDVRVLVLTGAGISFSAGHDSATMHRIAQADAAEQQRDLSLYAQLLSTLDTLPLPTLCKVQGSAFGIGVGLIACCDMVIAASDALFGFSDVRQGMISAVSAPYLVRAIGLRAARRYLISSERFNTGKAKRLGLIHQDARFDELDSTIEQWLGQLLINAPQAMHSTKQMLADIYASEITPELIERLIQRSVAARTSLEGREGINAFIEHRSPSWVRQIIRPSTQH